MNLNKILALAILASSLTGCGIFPSQSDHASTAYPPPAPAPVVAPAPAPPPPMVAASPIRQPASAAVKSTLRPIIASSILARGQVVPDRYPNIGYVLFARKPTKFTRDSYIAVCESFFGSFNDADDYVGVVPDKDVMPMYWMQTDRTPKTCEERIAKYDYSRSAVLLAHIGRSNTKGPLLVAWPRRGGKVIILDLKNFSDNDYWRAFSLWQQMISRPGIGTLAVYREAFRNFLQRYGDSILKATSIKA